MRTNSIHLNISVAEYHGHVSCRPEPGCPNPNLLWNTPRAEITVIIRNTDIDFLIKVTKNYLTFATFHLS